MGYACPVCSDPQADAGHLANHLAFTALLRHGEHEAWLSDHAPSWEKLNEAELAEIVSEQVEETDFPQLFEDTVGGLADGSNEPREERSGALFEDEHDDPSHGHTHRHTTDPQTTRGLVDTSGQMDNETEAIVEEAKQMTQRMYDTDEEDDDE